MMRLKCFCYVICYCFFITTICYINITTLFKHIKHIKQINQINSSIHSAKSCKIIYIYISTQKNNQTCQIQFTNMLSQMYTTKIKKNKNTKIKCIKTPLVVNKQYQNQIHTLHILHQQKLILFSCINIKQKYIAIII